MSFKKWAAAGAVVIVLGGGYTAYRFTKGDDTPVTAPADPAPSKPSDNTATPQPAPENNGTTPSNDTNSPKPAEGGTTTPDSNTNSDLITLSAFSGSGSYPLKGNAFGNNSFQLERIDWSESSKTLSFVGKMRAFEAVGYFRVRDKNKVVIESESPIKASAGAPEWGTIKADLALVPEYKGQPLFVDFYTKSAKDGSRTDMLTVKLQLQ
ncbi:Gmad2 immunoglobulin-like domain-containing protein [Tumebacillus flagellatus]|uniref:Bacterial spore germination immunoglobulin-like domain-containing protein n=1 Tax=Tumebacillus flagellatus TaxID=1157490 RepID=A0A074LR54_9BACL|nr:Gmad2 immunoglobulin-like domain-containing protein [Tumebacillus flagellatus]KEO83569.1 hypothetical protein EL26_09155 [Tumebacillus flagellatus]